MWIAIGLILFGVLSFDRGDWKHWTDSDKDCQSTRVEVLVSQAEQVMLTPDECRVEIGHWIDPYSLEPITGSPKLIDIDHVIPLKHAWETGGWAWDDEKRERFANDERFLYATHRSLNRQKGAKGPVAWMPPAPEVKCTYLRRWIEAKLEYGLMMSVHEAAYIFVHSGCGIAVEIASD
jgi:hypothetical protein